MAVKLVLKQRTMNFCALVFWDVESCIVNSCAFAAIDSCTMIFVQLNFAFMNSHALTTMNSREMIFVLCNLVE